MLHFLQRRGSMQNSQLGKVNSTKRINYPRIFLIWRWEFIQHVLHTNPSQFDEHYRPTSLFCSVCNFDFNYIIHYENLEEEEKYFVEDLEASNLIKTKWENSNKMNISNGEVVAEYFKLLTNKEIMKLYKIYENDFFLFNYQFEFREMKFNVPKLELPPPGTNSRAIVSQDIVLSLCSLLVVLMQIPVRYLWFVSKWSI